MQCNIVQTKNDLIIFRMITFLYLHIFTISHAKRRKLPAQGIQSTTATTAGNPKDHSRPPE